MIDQYKLNYIYSLLPSLTVLEGIQKVHICITSKLVVPDNSIEIGHANSINVHLFKPKYYSDQIISNEIECQVATLAVAKHVAKAWEIYSVYTKKKIEVNIDNLNVDVDTHTQRLYETLADNLVRELNPSQNVIFAKLDSVVGFLRMMELFYTHKLSKKLVEKLFVELELHRIKHSLASIHQDYIYNQYLSSNIKQNIYKTIPLDPICQGSFLLGQNFYTPTSNFTVINLPWGIDLAYVLGRAVLKGGAKNIYLIGGVGCVSDNVGVDDIFIADRLRDSVTDGVEFNNEFNDVSPISSKKFQKRVARGLLYCVRSSLDHQPHFSHKAKSDGIAAFDMESWGLLKATREFGGNLSMIHYIMDLPLQGMGLGATYYNEKFLKKLLKSRNRGKYFCFEAVLNNFFNWQGL